MREDNVGFAGLVDELIMRSIDVRYSEYGQPISTPLERIPAFLEAISTYIGNESLLFCVPGKTIAHCNNVGIFQLDPNRVLDILLDFFIKELLYNYQFWIQLFLQSGWIQYFSTATNGTPSGAYSTAMAHLLGFKFTYYQLYENKNAPAELYYACALLIKHGLIRLVDILPYLHPFDEGMATREERYMENIYNEINTNTGGLLAQFGALGENGTTERIKRVKPVSPEDMEKNSNDYNANDYVELTRALLAVGDVKHAEAVMAKYKKLVDMYPQLALHVYRLCDVMLDRPWDLFVTQQIKDQFQYFAERAKTSEEVVHPTDGVRLKEVLSTDLLQDGVIDYYKKQKSTFFYKEWREGLPKVDTFEGLVNQYAPVMSLAADKSYLAPNLVQKLAHIIQGLLERESNFPGCRSYCLAITRSFLLPAVSFSRGNPGTMALVWEVLERLTYQER